MTPSSLSRASRVVSDADAPSYAAAFFTARGLSRFSSAECRPPPWVGSSWTPAIYSGSLSPRPCSGRPARCDDVARGACSRSGTSRRAMARALGVHERADTQQITLLVFDGTSAAASSTNSSTTTCPRACRYPWRTALLHDDPCAPERFFAFFSRASWRRDFCALGSLSGPSFAAADSGRGLLHRQGERRPKVLALHWRVAVGLQSLSGGRPRRAVRVRERFRHGAVAFFGAMGSSVERLRRGGTNRGRGAKAGGRVVSRASPGSR